MALAACRAAVATAAEADRAVPALVARKLAFSAGCEADDEADDEEEEAVDAAGVDEDGAGLEAAADRVLRGNAAAAAVAAAADEDKLIAAFKPADADADDAEVTARIGRSESRVCCAELDDDDCRERCCDDDNDDDDDDDDDDDGFRPRAESKASASKPGSSMMRIPRLRASLPSVAAEAGAEEEADDEDEAARRARDDEGGRTGLATVALILC